MKNNQKENCTFQRKTNLTKKQHGMVLVLSAVSLLIMMGMLGLALDVSNTFAEKTNLQSGLDAAAISAATSLVDDRIATAVTDARATFNSYNLSVPAGNVNICFFDSYNQISNACNQTATANSKFVRATLQPDQGNWLKVQTYFAKVFGFNEFSVFSSAVAGPLSLTETCDLEPIVACVDSTDTDCSTGTGGCYGYEKNRVYDVKVFRWNDVDVGPGAFGLRDVGSGASDVCRALAGSNSCSVFDGGNDNSNNWEVDSQPGNKVGAVRCHNVKFDQYPPGNAFQVNYPEYKPDKVIDEYIGTKGFSDYKAIYDGGGIPQLPSGHEANDYERIMFIPGIDCADPISSGGGGGANSYDVKIILCFFATEPTGGTGLDSTIYGEFLGDTETIPECYLDFNPLPSQDAASFVPVRIVLYKDPNIDDG